MNEEWRPIESYEGLYEVSNLGRVRSLTVRVRNGVGTRVRRGRVLKQHATPEGYYTVMLSCASRQRRVQVSRLVGRAFLGMPADLEIDHEDRNPANNAASNLRVATTAQNHRNTRRPKTNTSGFKGVSWHRARGKWRASISVNNRTKQLGHFDTPEDAHAAYLAAAVALSGPFAHGG